MELILLLPSLFASFLQSPNESGRSLSTETDLRDYLNRADKTVTEWKGKETDAEWDFYTTGTPEKEKIEKKVAAEAALVYHKLFVEATKYDINAVENKTLARQLKFTVFSLNPKTKAQSELKDIVLKMRKINENAVVKLNGRTVKLYPELVKVMASSRDYTTLAIAWKGYRDAIGPFVLKLYPKYVALANQVARESSVAGLKYKNRVDLWLAPYETPDLHRKALNIWMQVEPFYKELHEFVRRKLLVKYYGQMVNDGNIPAHTLGNMWGHDWTEIMDIVNPFEGLSSLDVTEELTKQNYTVKRIMKLAESFFVGLGFPKMLPKFWEKSILGKPKGSKGFCQTASVNFHRQDDFRITTCLMATLVGLRTAHHEMGHIHYYMQYKHQPVAFRQGATPAVHEAIGDLIGISATVPAYLERVGLLKGYRRSANASVYALLQQAMVKVPSVAYSMAIEMWRYKVFTRQIPPEEYNNMWWAIRKKYHMITPPMPRSKNDLDPAAKGHVTGDVDYIRYFIGLFVQFQIHKKLCEIARYKELHECTIANNKEAGKTLREFLRQGASIDAEEQMVKLTGETLSAKAFLDYFEPLRKFLRLENSKPFEVPGDPFVKGIGNVKGRSSDSEQSIINEHMNYQMDPLYMQDRLYSVPDPMPTEYIMHRN